MVIHGHIQNGVVVPDDTISLPDGTAVSIVVQSDAQFTADLMSPEQHQRYLEALARIDALPNENPGDNFSGADHDRALYGDEP